MDSQEKPHKKFYKHWWFWVIVVLVFVVIGESGNSNPQAQTAQTAPTTQAAQTETANAPTQAAVAPTKQAAPVKTVSAPTPAPAPAPVPHVQQVLLQVSGSGTKSTQTFTAPSSWTLDYSYDCSSYGYKGNFQIMTYTADGNMDFSNTPVNQLGKSGSDTEYYHSGGQLYLEINSECSWTVTAKG